MRSVILIGACAAGMLVGTASGRPFVNKRAIVTEVVYVTETVANVVVYVDETGAPYLTSTETKVMSTLSSVVVSTTSAVVQPPTEPAPTPTAPSSSAAPIPPVAPVSSALPSSDAKVQAQSVAVSNTPSPVVEKAQLTTSSPPPAPTTSEQPAPPPPAPSSAAPSSAAPAAPVDKAGSGSSLGLGVTYDPFKGSKDSPDCKSDTEMTNDFDRMKDYKAIRIYGQGCNQIPRAVESVIKYNQKLMVGVYLTTRGNGETIDQVIDILKKAIDTKANGNWDVVSLFSVENERVNDHDMTASAVVDAINQARSKLRGIGYNGPVGAVETVPATIDNPSICKASDVVMVNCHAFFDVNTEAKDAGTFVKSEVDRVKQACDNKRVVVTESGWPHQGNANGKAVPSPGNQRAAIDSIRSQFKEDMFLHNAFDSTWKGDVAVTFNAEQFWGIIQ